jgi:molybdopterin-guanine dinucleotide biosynthesis protein A
MFGSSRKHNLTGAVLAGGLGRRLGGIDKGLMTVGGLPMVERVLGSLVPQVDRVLINANRHAPQYARYGFPVVADRESGFQGPLAGIAGALASAETEYVLCVPCDAAWLPPDLASRMREALQKSDGTIAAVHDGTWLHPVCCMIPRALLPDLRQWLSEGRREVSGWLQRHSLVTVDFSDWPSAFWSINTPEDLATVEKRLQNSTTQPPRLILEGAA